MRRRLSFKNGFGPEFDSPHLHSIRLSFHSRLTRGKPPRLLRASDSLNESSAPSEVEGLIVKHNTSPKGDVLCFTYRMYFVYMIRNSYGDLYTGITDDPKRRLLYHNENRGALFTKRESKFKIVFLEQHPDITSARKREIQIKKWRREKKDALVKRYIVGMSTKL